MKLNGDVRTGVVCEEEEGMRGGYGQNKLCVCMYVCIIILEEQIHLNKKKCILHCSEHSLSYTHKHVNTHTHRYA